MARYVNHTSQTPPNISITAKIRRIVMGSLSKPKLKLCDCGCGGYPRGSDYMPGHDVRIYSAIVGHVGSLKNLREVVERYTGKPVNMNYE